jgi:hypothetical protein
MTFEQFHNGLRLLRSIDLHELQAEGLWKTAGRGEMYNAKTAGGFEQYEQWCKFRDTPHDFLIRCDDDTAAKIWSAMVKRGATA